MINLSIKDMVIEGKSYFYKHARGNPSHAYLLPILQEVMTTLSKDEPRAIDVGCGNGFVSDFIARGGFRVVGVDPSNRGMEIARQHFPAVEYYQGTAYEDLASMFGQFDLTVSLEVVEHLYSPKTFARTLFLLTKPGGVCVVSTPYHGYLKNLVLAASGRFEKHLNPLNEGGHIKFFSIQQLTSLLQEVGFHIRRIHRVGRIPALAKSMVIVANRLG